MTYRTGDWISGGLTVVGALNWGLVGLFGFNLVHSLFNWSRPIERFIYSAVGLAGAMFAFRVIRARGVAREQRVLEPIEERRPIGVV